MKFTRILFVVSMILLQAGISYYLSFQTIALLIVLWIVIKHCKGLNLKPQDFFAFILFVVFAMFTAFQAPDVISSNSDNFLFTMLALVFYSAIIFFMPLLVFSNTLRIFWFFHKVSKWLIISLVGILILSESGIIPTLNRQAMRLQNASLITNSTDVNSIEENIKMNLSFDLSERIDIFYGEPSFFVLILFASLSSFMISKKAIKEFKFLGSDKILISEDRYILILAIMAMLYVQSLSSVIYSAILIYFLFKGQLIKKKLLYKNITIIALLVFTFSYFIYDYLLSRLVEGSGLSFYQRFGWVVDLDIITIFTGLKNSNLLVDGGIHNGLIYILLIAGIGGVFYIFRLLRNVYFRANKLEYGFLAVLVVLAIIMQNGAILSINKIVISSLILLPLACTENVLKKNK